MTYSRLVIAAVMLGFGIGWMTASKKSPESSKPQWVSAEPPAPADHLHVPQSPVGRQFTRALNSPDDCLRAIDEAEALRGEAHPLVLTALRDRALRRWLELDPEGALAYAETKVKGNYEPGIAADLFRVWIDLDLESALNGFSQASPLLVNATRDTFFTNMAQIDPERTVDMLSKPPWEGNGHQWMTTMSSVFAIWASKDPQAAAETGRKMTTWTDYFGPAKTIAAVWAEKDPAAAWAYFQANQIAKNRQAYNDVRTLLAGYMLEEDPNTDISSFDEYRLGQLAEKWAKRDPESAIAAARSRRAEDDALSQKLFMHAARELATANPKRALSLLGESGDPENDTYEEHGLLRQAFASLASAGIEDALTNAAALPDNRKAHALSGIFTHQFALDQESALKSWRRLLDDPSVSQSVLPAMKVALSWGHGGGVHQLGTVLETIPEFNDHVDGYPLQGWARTDPEEAARFMTERAIVKGDDYFGDTQAVSELAISRPEFTAEWIADLPDGKFRNHVAASLALNWSRFNAPAAAHWIETLLDGPTKEAAINAKLPEPGRR